MKHPEIDFNLSEGEGEEDEDEESEEELEESDQLHLAYSRKFARDNARTTENRFVTRASRWIVYYLGAYWCNLDLKARQSEQRPGNFQSLEQLQHYEKYKRRRVKPSVWKEKLKRSWISGLVLGIYCTCSLYLFLNVYRQYAYDLAKLRLLSFQKARSTIGSLLFQSSSTSSNKFITEQVLLLEAQVRMAKSSLDLVGSAYSQLSILAQCLMLAIWAVPTCIYLTTMINYRNFVPFDLPLVRDLLEDEQEHTKQLVRQEVLKFLASSRVARFEIKTQLQEEELIRRLEISKKLRASARPMRRPPFWPSGHKSNQFDRRPSDTLLAMVANNSLMPLNKSKRWLERRDSIQFTGHTLILCYIVLCTLTTTQLYLRPSEEGAPLLSLADWLQISSCVTLLIISFLAFVIYPTLYCVAILDQIIYVRKLRCLIMRCCELNMKLYYCPKAHLDRTKSNKRQAQQHPNAETLNSNLIFTLLHFKIFVAQLAPIKQTIGVLNIIAMVFLFLVPVIARLHVPYLNQLDNSFVSAEQVRIYAFALNMTTVLPVNGVLIPNCYFYARCRDACRDLSSLMARVLEVKSSWASLKMSNKLDGSAREWDSGDSYELDLSQQIYDPHTLALMDKELADSSRLLSQFTIDSACMRGTYITLVKANFWWGLVSISTIMDSRTSGRRDLISVLLNDPLGVLS